MSVSYGPGLRGDPRPLDLDTPGVVFLGRDSSRSWEAQEVPLPAPIALGAKEEPQVDSKVLAGVREEVVPTAKTPGCASSGAVATSPVSAIPGARADYREGMKRYLSGDFEGAIESLSKVVAAHPDSELSGYSDYYIGESFYHLGRSDEALARFEQFVKRYPNNQRLDWAHYSVGWIYLEKKDFQKAVTHFQSIAGSQRDSPLAPMALFGESEALGRSGRLEEAVAGKGLFLEMYPTHSMGPEVQFSMGGDLLRLHRFREAAEVFREFVATHPSHSFREEAVYGLGIGLIYDERYDEGVSVLKAHLERFPNTPLAGSILFGLVKGYLGKDELDMALETYEELVARFPHFEWADNALFDIGNSSLRKGDYTRSMEIYQNLLRIHPGSDLKALVYFNLGEASYNLNHYDEAIDSYGLAREVTREDSLLEEILFRMGLSFYQQRSYNRAIESWALLLEDFPDSIRRGEAVYRMGEAFLQNRDPKRAMKLFRGFEENADIYPRVLNSLGRYYFQEEEWNSAIRYFLELLDRYPYHPLSSGAYLRLGEAFYNRRDYPKALSYLDELARREDAENLDRAYFIQGRIYYKEGKFDLAIDRLSKILALSPQSPLAGQSQYWIAWSYYRMGMYEKAIGEFTRVTENPPSSEHASQALLRIGDCYYHRGSYLEARLTYLEVIREFPGSREAPEAEYGILLAFERQGMYDNFVDRAGAFLSRYPTHPLGAEILSRLAQYNLDSHQVDKAIVTYRELLRKYSRSDLADDAQFKLGEIYREQEDFENAIVEFGLVVKKYPRSNHLADAYFKIAQSYFALGDYRKALEGYRRVATGFPESHLAGEAYLGAVDCFERLGRVDLAEKRLVELMENYPNHSIRFQGALRLGLILFADVRYAEAIEALRKATKSRDPDVASLAQLKIGEIYRKMGDSSTAIVELMKAIYLYPGQVKQVDAALFQTGEIYMEQKKWVDARQVYSNVIEMSRSESARQKARSMLSEIDRRTGNQ